jgi:hypothetical protein
MVDHKKPMAIVEIPYKCQTLILNADDAFALFKILCNAEFIEYDYNAKGHKHVVTNDRPSLKVFSITDYAQLALNTEPE